MNKINKQGRCEGMGELEGSSQVLKCKNLGGIAKNISMRYENNSLFFLIIHNTNPNLSTTKVESEDSQILAIKRKTTWPAR